MNRPSPARRIRSCPITAPRRASSVDSCSGVGWARVNSVCCSTRPGVGSMTIVTRSIAAAGGRASRSSSASVRSARTSRSGDGSCRRRTSISRVTSPSSHVQHRGAAVAPLELRRERLEETASGRTTAARALRSATRDRATTRTAPPASVGMNGRTSSPRAIACHRSAGCPRRDARSAGGSAAISPNVLIPHRPSTASTFATSSAGVGLFTRVAPGIAVGIAADAFSSIPMGSGASAPAADREGSTTVKPGHACARTSAAVRVPASATCTRARARGRGAPQLFANRRRRADETPQSANVDRHEIVPMPLVPRRKSLRDGNEEGPPSAPALRRRGVSVRRSIKACEHLPGAAEHCRCFHRSHFHRYGRANGPNDARLEIEAVEQPAAKTSAHGSRVRRPLSQLQRQPRRAARHRLASHQHARRVAAFDETLEPQPGGERQPADRVARRVGDIERDETEVPRRENEREGFDRLIDRPRIQVPAKPWVRHGVPANP